MFKMRIVRPNYKAHVGLFFTYAGQQFKVVRIGANGNLYFAWWDGKLKKVLTTDMTDPGQEPHIFSRAVADERYEIINKRLVHPAEFRDFTLF